MHWLTMAALKAEEKFWYGHNACFAYDHSSALKKLEEQGTPTLILTNTGDVCYPYAQRTKELCPSFSYAEMTGGTFDYANENPKLWSDEVLKFVKAL